MTFVTFFTTFILNVARRFVTNLTSRNRYIIRSMRTMQSFGNNSNPTLELLVI